MLYILQLCMVSLISTVSETAHNNSHCRLYKSPIPYPPWAGVVGLTMSLSSMVMVPSYAVYYVLSQPGSILQNIRQGLKPNMTLRTEATIAINQVGAVRTQDYLRSAETQL